MINFLKLNFFKVFIKFLMGAVMEDCGLIYLSYLYGSFDGEIFPFIRDTSWKKLKGFQVLKIWKVPNSRKGLNGNNKGVQDILSWYIINVC